MCYRRVCGSTPGDWDADNPVLAISLRRCRTTAYTSSAVPRFPNMLLSPRPFGSRSVVRLGVMSPELRPPLVAIPSVRDTAHTFASYGSRQRDIMGKVHFASSTVPSPWTALRVRWVPVYWCPTLSLRALPKPRCRHLDSATKPDMNVSVHPAPQQRGVCHTYLGNQSLWLFSYRDNVDATVASCLSHPSLRPFWAGCDRLPSCLHP